MDGLMKREDDLMTASTKATAKVVHIKIRQDARGVFVATSPNLHGFSAVSKDRERLECEVIPRAIVDLYKACGEQVVVARVEDDNEAQWVALSADLARRALDETVTQGS
jgi:hypothetical protein